MTNPTKVYIAAPFGRARDALRVAVSLEKQGFLVESCWFWKLSNTPEEESRLDLDELERSDVILVLDDPNNAGCATYWELGYAYASGKPCFVIDQPKPYRCIFYYLPGIVKVRSVEEFVERVKALEEVAA